MLPSAVDLLVQASEQSQSHQNKPENLTNKKCCVPNCNYITYDPLGKNEGVSLHKMRDQWKILCNITEEITIPDPRICSSHFEPQMITCSNKLGHKGLTPEAIPTLFPNAWGDALLFRPPPPNHPDLENGVTPKGRGRVPGPQGHHLKKGFEDAEVSTDLSTLLLRATPVDIERGYITVGKTDGGKKAGNILKKHHAPWTYVCVHCGFTRSAATSTNGIKLIRQHVNIEHTKIPLDCSECSFTTFNSDILSLHRLNVHNLKAMKCPLEGCKFTGLTIDKMKNHVMQKHQINPDGLSFVADVKDQSKPARIGDVLESARKSAKYYEIIRDEDGKMCGVRCTLCPKETKTIANMAVHVNSQHVKESLYCIWCDFTTFNESTLQCHVKKKHNYKKVKCEVAGCNYSSIEKGKFQRHSESHQSVLSSDQAGNKSLRQRSCRWCDYTTLRYETLHNHFKRKHGGENSKCADCKFTGISKEAFKKHLDTQHAGTPNWANPAQTPSATLGDIEPEVVQYSATELVVSTEQSDVRKDGGDVTTHFVKSRKRNAVALEQESPIMKAQKLDQDKSELDLAVESIAQENQLEPQPEATSHTRSTVQEWEERCKYYDDRPATSDTPTNVDIKPQEDLSGPVQDVTVEYAPVGVALEGDTLEDEGAVLEEVLHESQEVTSNQGSPRQAIITCELEPLEFEESFVPDETDTLRDSSYQPGQPIITTKLEMQDFEEPGGVLEQDPLDFGDTVKRMITLKFDQPSFTEGDEGDIDTLGDIGTGDTTSPDNSGVKSKEFLNKTPVLISLGKPGDRRTCPHCLKDFHRMSLGRHIQDKHSKKTSVDSTCQLCCKKFATENSLHCHLNKLHGVTRKFNVADNSANSKLLACKEPGKRVAEKKYCKYCGKVFHEMSLARHIRDVHERETIGGSSEVTCQICLSVYATKNSFSKHLSRVHKIRMADYEAQFAAGVHKQAVKTDSQSAKSLLGALQTPTSFLEIEQADSLPSDGPKADAQPEIDEAPPASKSGDSENLVWNYFHRAANRLLCKNCPRSFISSLSLKSARKHLKVKHPEDFSILLSAEATVRKINKGCAEKEGKSGNDHFSDQERGFTTVFLERAQKGILASSSGVRDKIFQCNYCDFSDKSVSSIRDHVNAKHHKIPLECTECPHTTYSWTSLSQHRQTQHNLTAMRCPLCKFRSSVLFRLEKHVEKRHQGVQVEGFIAEVYNKNKPIGPLTTHSKKPLTEHYTINSDGGSKVWSCNHCKKGFNSYTLFQVHLNAEHIKNSLQCVWCDWTSFNETSLQSHVRLKHGYKKKQCYFPNCNYGSVEANKLKKHLEVHQEEVVALQGTTIKPKKVKVCVWCTYTAPSSQALYHHIKKKHDGAKKPCPVAECTFECNEESFMSEHMRKCHSLAYNPTEVADKPQAQVVKRGKSSKPSKSSTNPQSSGN